MRRSFVSLSGASGAGGGDAAGDQDLDQGLV